MTVLFFQYLLDTLLVLTSLFLICLILIQRGKGGGLAGAFGGAGGSSAFGTKAGDVFTRITMITAGIWISLSMLLVVLSNQRTSAFIPASGTETKSPFTPSKDGAAKTEGATDKAASLEPAPANAPAAAAPAAPPVAPISSQGPSAPIPVTPLPTTPAPK
ncbi:preprotein translocase subunit SecG [Tundrisphaera sp. TA3]|uniref:preprotein translocase subunit SecG n=1 Tax=Tundrisphaera sp. TA3 TaxID=3435775 RepID=UPI003EBFD107